MSEPSWFNQLHHEWHALQRHDAALDVEKFYRHVMSAYKSGFASFEAIATTANALLLSTIPGAPYLGRKLFERVGVNKHPSLRVAYALSLFAGTGGDTDPTAGNIILADVLKDRNAQDALKGLAAAAHGDSARLGRGGDTDLERAKAYHEIAFNTAILTLRVPLDCTGITVGTRRRQVTVCRIAHARRAGTNAVNRRAGRLSDWKDHAIKPR